MTRLKEARAGAERGGGHGVCHEWYFSLFEQEPRSGVGCILMSRSACLQTWPQQITMRREEESKSYQRRMKDNHLLVTVGSAPETEDMWTCLNARGQEVLETP